MLYGKDKVCPDQRPDFCSIYGKNEPSRGQQEPRVTGTLFAHIIENSRQFANVKTGRNTGSLGPGVEQAILSFIFTEPNKS